MQHIELPTELTGRRLTACFTGCRPKDLFDKCVRYARSQNVPVLAVVYTPNAAQPFQTKLLTA